jgi:hypothetical protein
MEEKPLDKMFRKMRAGAPVKPELLEGEIERMLTVEYIARQWQTSTDTVRRVFSCEQGVMRIGHETQRIAKGYRRKYFTLRVPLSVYLRVQDRLQQKPQKPSQKPPRRRSA